VPLKKKMYTGRALDKCPLRGMKRDKHTLGIVII